jgi:hypothetical protein
MADYSLPLSPERRTIRARSQSKIGSPGRRFTAAMKAAFAVRKSFLIPKGTDGMEDDQRWAIARHLVAEAKLVGDPH